VRDRDIFFAVALAGGFIWVASRVPETTISIKRFINPKAVSYIASRLPEQEDDFILSAWNIVGGEVKYKPFGSVLHFNDSTVKCLNCLLPDRMLEMSHPESNCVGKSVLLTSILRNRLSAGRVYVVMGSYQGNPKIPPKNRGHAWVAVKRMGVWYVLESTVPPSRTNPWYSMSSLSGLYAPEAFINDYGIFCSTETDMCGKPASYEIKGICPCQIPS
jgi:hypothetical protein